MAKTVVVIPARWGSTRFPGKPLASVAGVPMVQRVWALARAAEGVDGVYIATDDQRIADAARDFDAYVVMTPEDCRNGTERAHAAAAQMAETPDIVINLQGDAVLTPPWVIGAVAGAFADPAVRIATPAMALDDAQLAALEAHKTDNPASGTTVVLDCNFNALYFSKAIIPFRRRPGAPVYRHVGIYGYRRETLAGLVKLPEGVLERTEGLEQLRALENGIPIRVIPVDYRGRTHWSVDSPDDLTAAEDLIAREGELLTAYDGTGTVRP
ncbi:MAG: 3-deoxy-manno-octulosonate cytidylyltransferase [Rhodospirillales bacterium CG15_BIG_FIL_POST_REV_8_21_14_020_66_15]|nr:MAG: 3-deoxy-manno-octulosonate cytidylyltransferase [Rhodospirillales bacterium CG15_BIG_FIL_POST_REV_8_21_14_020_66_15]